MYLSGAFIFLLGAVFGSFLNSLEWRLKNRLSVLGRSECPNCRKQIKWSDNVPILSFLILRGKCRFCKKNIAWQYPVVELLMGVGWVLIWLFSCQGEVVQHTAFFIYECFVFWVFTFIFIYDLKYGEVLDAVTLAPATIFAVTVAFLGWNSWHSILAGIAFGCAFFAFQYLASRGRWIGGGDIRIGILMGAVLGWPKVLVAIIIAYVVGAIFSVFFLITKRKKMGDSVPLGAFLAVAAMLALFYGEQIVNWYLSFLIW